MASTCKDCRYYSTDELTVGVCTCIHCPDYGLLVWPSKKSCEKIETKQGKKIRQEKDRQDLHSVN
jgi:hypothetical protein